MKIHTPRLVLIPATVDLVGLEMSSNEQLGHALAAEVPADWPPEQVVDALPWFHEQLRADPALSGWLGWYALATQKDGKKSILVGGGGFLGRPVEGVAEIGYSVLPAFQGQGYATEMIGGLVDWALAQPRVEHVVAETHTENAASRRVLTKLGFVPVGAGRDPGYLRFEHRESLETRLTPS